MHQRKKWFRGNNKPLVNKMLSKAIMKRSKLKIKQTRRNYLLILIIIKNSETML